MSSTESDCQNDVTTPSDRSQRWLFGLLAVVVVASGLVGRTVMAEEKAPAFHVVVHPDNPNKSVEREFLVRAFLKKTTRWQDGTPLRPVDQDTDSEVRKRFSEAVLRRSVSAIKSYWHQRIFAGRGVPPPELETDGAVLRYVQKHRGAVGYVSARAEIQRVKRVTVR